MLEILYGLALGVVIVGVMVAALAPSIPTGVVGTVILAGIGLCQLAAVERFGEAPNWRVLLSILEAALVLWMGARWIRSR